MLLFVILNVRKHISNEGPLGKSINVKIIKYNERLYLYIDRILIKCCSVQELSVQLQSVNQEYAQIKNINNNLREKLEAEEKHKTVSSSSMCSEVRAMRYLTYTVQYKLYCRISVYIKLHVYVGGGEIQIKILIKIVLTRIRVFPRLLSFQALVG